MLTSREEITKCSAFLVVLLANLLPGCDRQHPPAPDPEEERISEIRAYLKAGGDVNATDSTGMNFLHNAAYRGQVKVVRALLDLGADVNAPSPPQSGLSAGYTPLHWAAACGTESGRDVAEILLDHGADANAKGRSSHDWTPLHVAAFSGNPSTTRLLVSRGSDIHATASGLRPTHLAVLFDNIADARILIGAGAEVDIFCASGLGDVEKVAGFLEKNPKLVNAKVRESDDSPLHWAARAGRTEVVRLLLAEGAEVDAQNDIKRTALHVAADKGQTDVVKLLVENGSNLEIRGAAGQTPLHEAVSSGHYDVAEFLLRKGADVNTRNYRGEPPLYWAAFNGERGMTQLLLSYGAQVNVKNARGRDPIDAAVFAKHPHIAELLRKHKTSSSARGSDRHPGVE